MFNKTHTRIDGKVDVNLIADNGETVIYHRSWPLTNDKHITVQWGACSSERFNKEFIPCL